MSPRLKPAAIGALVIAGAPLLAWPAAGQGQQPRTEVAPFQHGVHAAPSGGPTAYEEAAPPLFDNLGKHTWKITTRTPEAQAFFDQGLRLAYGFNHAEARRAFRQAQQLDPSSAISRRGTILPELLAPAIAAASRLPSRSADAFCIYVNCPLSPVRPPPNGSQTRAACMARVDHSCAIWIHRETHPRLMPV